MTGNSDGEAANGPRGFVPGPAASSSISLSQAILAPLDAIAKAQVHAARSFLNFVLQIGYPHRPHSPSVPSVNDLPASSESMYTQRFQFEQTVQGDDGKPVQRHVEISVPTLALVPLQPLSVDSAHYDVELVVSGLERHNQIQVSEAESLEQEQSAKGPDGKPIPTQLKPRPWYLVPEPVSVRGTLTDPGGGASGQQKQASIKVHVEVKSVQVPAGLSKLIGAMTQLAGLSDGSPAPQPAATPPQPGAVAAPKS